jgi:hypothetical protein
MVAKDQDVVVSGSKLSQPSLLRGVECAEINAQIHKVMYLVAILNPGAGPAPL